MNHRNLTKKKDSRRNSRNKSSPIQAICYDIIDEDNYDVTYKENRTEILKAVRKFKSVISFLFCLCSRKNITEGIVLILLY